MLLEQMTKEQLSENIHDGYYHFQEDLEKQPDAWLYVAWSLRGPGKTYSALWYMVRNKIPFIYMRRTNIDVKNLCSPLNDFEQSPFKPINRDKGTQIYPVLASEGMGGFYEFNSEGEPEGPQLGKIVSFAKFADTKSIDMSEYDFIIMDEFIPLRGQIVKKAEGDMLLTIYMTARRDRTKRGRKDLKLVLFGNGSEIATPITAGLSLIDDLAEMNSRKTLYYYEEERMISYHHVTAGEYPMAKIEDDAGIMKAMKGTAWAATELEGEFGYNDFSNVLDMSIKGMRPYLKLKYHKTQTAYIYYREYDGMYYMTTSGTNQKVKVYDLNRENEQKRFWIEQGVDLRIACIEDRMKFKKYSMYDLIVNYKRYFTI